MSVSADTGNPDLEAAISGGSTFDQRIAALAAAKQSLMDAYTDLGMGQSAKQAFDDATAAKAAAEQALSAAKADAENIVAAARNEALAIQQQEDSRAEEKRAALMKDVEAQKAAAEKLFGDADFLSKKAAADVVEAAKLKSDAEDQANALAEKIAKAEAAAAEHTKAAEDLRSLRARMVAALAIE